MMINHSFGVVRFEPSIIAGKSLLCMWTYERTDEYEDQPALAV